MPSRLACVVILLWWAIGAMELLRNDVLPDLLINAPPNLQTIAGAEEVAIPTRWDIRVADDPALQNLRSIGQAVTSSKRRNDGGVDLVSHVGFDSGSMLRGTPFAHQHNERIEVDSTCEIDPRGNLHGFRAVVRSASDSADLMTLEGKVKGGVLTVETTGRIPALHWTRNFPYEPRGMVQNSLGPIDRIPGLQVGQRWESKVVSPLTGQVEVVKVEVTRKRPIYWDKSQVTTLEVVHHLTPLSARTWVRRDGLVLRQEVPFPFVKLILERQPDRGSRGLVGVQAP